MPLINGEINLTLTCSANCVFLEANRVTVTKLYVPVVTLSTHDHRKLLQQFKSGLRHTVNWNKYQSKVSTQVKKTIFKLFN